MTTLQEADVVAIIADTTKVVQSDIVWRPDDNVSGEPSRSGCGFLQLEQNDLVLRGMVQPPLGQADVTRCFTPQVGRIYGLDLGANHNNEERGTADRHSQGSVDARGPGQARLRAGGHHG